MKVKLKNIIKCGVTISVILAIIVTSIYIKYGGFSSGNAVSTEQIMQYAKPIDAITIDRSVKIIGLGEATHGNVEFQVLKKDVLMQVVSSNNVTALALETDFASAILVNSYISGISNDRDTAIKNLGFKIYQTEQMGQLLDAIKAFNATCDPTCQIHFYGFDMQHIKSTLDLISLLARQNAIDINELFTFFDTDQWKEGVDYTEFKNVSKTILTKFTNTNDEQILEQLLTLLDQNYLLKHESDIDKAMDLRDKFMAENVQWIVDQENKRDLNCTVMISGHNSHIGKWNGVVSLGSELENHYGDSYYCIGTDFYHTKVNLPKKDKRTIKRFYSLNPIAKGVHRAQLNCAWFDFSEINEGELLDTINTYIYMGNIGERYSVMMKFIPLMYRMYQQPSQLFDSMIIVDEATPTQIIE